MKEKLKSLREKYLPYDEVSLRRLALATTFMFSWILVWALVFKLGNEVLLVGNYTNLKDMTLEERILWDLIPFNYRGEGEYKLKLIMDTVLNCFVFAPLGVTFCYIFKKVNVWRNAAICLAFSIGVELLQLVTILGNPATEDLITNYRFWALPPHFQANFDQKQCENPRGCKHLARDCRHFCGCHPRNVGRDNNWNN